MPQTLVVFRMHRLRQGPRVLDAASGALLALLVTLAGCALPAKPERPDSLPFKSAEAFSSAGELPPPERWWRAFDDPALSERIEQGLAKNLTLEASWQRLQAAQAVADRARADLWPDLDGTARVDDQNGGSGSDSDSELSLGVQAAYEVDLWGRIRRAADAEALRAEAQRADYQTAALTLAGQITRTWYRLSEARLQLRVLSDQIDTNETVLELLRTRFGAGLIRSADILRQQQLLAATREQAEAARARIAVLDHQLAVLQGRPPQAAAETEATALPALPPVPATGLPAELVERRPDVRAAFLALAAADQGLAAAVRAQYPRLDLSAATRSVADNPGDLFDEWLTTVAAQVIGPLLDGGERRAEVRRTQAVRGERLAEYGQTVLTAFQEVEDAVSNEERQRARIGHLARQLRLARQTSAQLRTQYLNGVTDYLAVLTALTEEQQLQRDLLSARLNLVEFRIQLYQALAGAFETPREVATTSAGRD